MVEEEKGLECFRAELRSLALFFLWEVLPSSEQGGKKQSNAEVHVWETRQLVPRCEGLECLGGDRGQQLRDDGGVWEDAVFFLSKQRKNPQPWKDRELLVFLKIVTVSVKRDIRGLIAGMESIMD